jgi:hypothetical protein
MWYMPTKEGRGMIKQASIALSLFSVFIAGCTQENTTTDKKTETAPVESTDPGEINQSTHDQDQQNTENDSTPTTKNPSTSDQNDDTNNSLTQEKVIASVKDQIQNNLTPRLPKHLPVSSKEMQLSAATYSESDMYRVIFFESKETIPINSKQLNDSDNAKPIAEIEVRKYETVQEAESKIGYISPEDIQTGNPAIDLGYSIKGYPDAGAGNKWLNWHEGRWYLQVHASNIEGNNDYLPLAKSMVDYLEHNKLPVPHEYGSVKADVERKKAENNRISWQEETIVYTISNVENPIDMLTIASHFENTEK